ncbi:hypothetical protein KY290_016717 [Solanum tuberosum]|uniref:Uncharacterized protein n=1 Tax=Solanum tuberosum TaxID=4113 RepID=A0ABQ7VAV0_SOLTU|nr:hypothetical protein KY284_015998 [Solanum tuberosum]KAH0760644.1 hypothetical protein KY290_016717 [Solanum tuberosum]
MGFRSKFGGRGGRDPAVVARYFTQIPQNPEEGSSADGSDQSKRPCARRGVIPCEQRTTNAAARMKAQVLFAAGAVLFAAVCSRYWAAGSFLVIFCVNKKGETYRGRFGNWAWFWNDKCGLEIGERTGCWSELVGKIELEMAQNLAY